MNNRRKLDLSAIRAITVDLDGVVWRGTETLPGVPDIFIYLRERHIPYLMLSNNSTKTVAEYVQRLDKLGIPIDGDHILTSAVITAEAIAREYPAGTPIYVIGSESLIQLMTARGNVFDPENAKIVIIGLDVNLTYEKLKIATQRILAGADFIATNIDETIPTAEGVAPGAGSIVAAVQTATGQIPRVMGKPGIAMFQAALEHLKTTPEQTMMIGDRLATDIIGAQRAGLKTSLVLTGISQESEVGNPILPDGVYESLADLHAAWLRT